LHAPYQALEAARVVVEFWFVGLVIFFGNFCQFK
jgi:hypothetical protein